MIREDRYLVIKRKDIHTYLTDTEKDILFTLTERVKFCRELDCKDTHNYIVLSDSWPEYEMAWKAIEKRIDG